jgi:YD repeat-containing protein
MDGLANVTTSSYDAKGNLISVRDANRKTAGASPETGTAQCGTDGTGNGWDDDNDPADDSVIDDGCLSVAYTYDNADRLVKVVQAAVSTTSIPTTNYGYDANGNRLFVTGPRAAVRPVRSNGPETFAQCGPTGFGNGVNEDLAFDDTVADDGCPSSFHAYDALDRLQSSTDGLGRVTSYQYDLGSNLTQRTDGRGLVTKYIPDDANRLDLIEHRLADNTLVDTVDYTYNAVGFRTQMVDPTGTASYTPDALDRISSITFPGPKIVSYTYDDAPGGSVADYPGQRTKITYPDSKYVDYTYRADGLLKTVSDWLGKQTVYTYDYAGLLTETRLPNSTCTGYGYDAADRLTSVVNRRMADPLICAPTDTTISSFSYSLDAVGNRTQMAEPAGTHSYQYDALYRLTQATYPARKRTCTNTMPTATGRSRTRQATRTMHWTR